MSLYKTFKTNEKLEKKEGVWFEFEEDVRILCRRAGGSNEEYTKAIRKWNQKRSRAIANGAISRKETDRELAKIYADTIILDWKNVKDADGKEMKFSKENAIKLLTDLPDFFDVLANCCTDHQNYIMEEEAAATAKNS